MVPGESTQCVVLNLGNPAAVHIGEIHNVSTDGVFDLVVYRSSATEEQTTPFTCPAFGNLGSAASDSALILSHEADDDMVLPAGAGLTLQPNQMLRLELHALNNGGSPQLMSATSTLVALADADFHSETAFVFAGDVDIGLNANSSGMTQGFIPMPSYIVASGSKVGQLSGYTHSDGTDVTLATGPDAGGPLTTVYDPTGWVWNQSPRLDAVPPASFGNGGGFEITCKYVNVSNQYVSSGPASTQQEACFFQGYAYPAPSGAFVCLHSDTLVPGGLDECCPDDGGVGCSGLF
jgi:hypothetical protein